MTICVNCGDDDATEGQRYCSDCLELSKTYVMPMSVTVFADGEVTVTPAQFGDPAVYGVPADDAAMIRAWADAQ